MDSLNYQTIVEHRTPMQGGLPGAYPHTGTYSAIYKKRGEALATTMLPGKDYKRKYVSSVC